MEVHGLTERRLMAERLEGPRCVSEAYARLAIVDMPRGVGKRLVFREYRKAPGVEFEPMISLVLPLHVTTE